jgi:DNA-binding CsgD family transcriptional regulator
MSDINFISKFSIKHSNKLKMICEPLRQYFGINHFWYTKTTDKGDFFSIGSNTELHDFYYSNKFFKYSPFFRNPEYMKPGVYCYPNFKDSTFLESLDKCAQKCQVELNIGIVYKNGNNLIRFGYGTPPKERDTFREIFLNNLPLLKKFNEYFLNEAQDLISTANDNLVSLPKEMGEMYYRAPKNFGPSLSSQEKSAFLHALGLFDKNLINRLSPREIECLKYYYNGFTASQTSARLYISPRTVEHHFESIKNKLNCFAKGNLYPYAQLLDIMGFFDN